MNTQRIFQIFILLAAAGVGIYLTMPKPTNRTANTDLNSANDLTNVEYDMLDHIDKAIHDQENDKDVRCWSSVNKIQMFLTNMPIESEAIGQRVESYVEMINSVWVESSERERSLYNAASVISKSTLVGVLQSRFPHSLDPKTSETEFSFGSDNGLSLTIDEEAVEDYSDTIEGWRLLQSWAQRNTDEKGDLTISPTFSKEAVMAFRDFLVVYDIALLKNAKKVAMADKVPKVDVATMKKAFDQLQKLGTKANNSTESNSPNEPAHDWSAIVLSPSPESRNEYSGRKSSWIGWVITAAIATIVILLALVVRNFGQDNPIPLTADAEGIATLDNPTFVPRTRMLVAQKVDSLFKYNDDRPLSEILEFYKSQTGHTVSPKAFEELTNQIVKGVIPLVWKRSQSETLGPSILHREMHHWIQFEYPHTTLTNADVIVYPNAKDLRIVVSEPNTDFFRDSGWHWKWIGNFLDSSLHELKKKELASDDPKRLKELDPYAAEELSEFLSVLGVAVIEMAARNQKDKSLTIGGAQIAKVFSQMSDVMPIFKDPRQIELSKQEFLFSPHTKKQLLGSLPDPMFRDITEDVGLNFVHVPDIENWKLRSSLRVPVGIAGGGVSVNDFDSDGDHDVYFAGANGGGLFANSGNGKFTNVTKSAGIITEGETRAGYFIDYDNDGDNDLFLTQVGKPHLLLENSGDATFKDVTKSLNLRSGDHVTHEAVWVDVNNDGLLDVYVANFGDWRKGAVPTLGRKNANAPRNELFIQRLAADGTRTFEELSERYKVDDRGWTHCVGAYDFNRDGWMDLFSLNDFWGKSRLSKH